MILLNRYHLFFFIFALSLQLKINSCQQSPIDDQPIEENKPEEQGQCVSKEQCTSNNDKEKSEEKCQCNSKEQCTCNNGKEKSEKYSKEKNEEEDSEINNKWQKYRDLVDKALKNYKECESLDCSCYQDQIKSDLKPWSKNGIDAKLLKEASKIPRNSHYQIIDHKLYRDNDVMFPARSRGIEYFLLKIVKDLPDTEFILNTKDWPQTSSHSKKLPIFSFSKVDSDHSDIMYPAWTFWEGGPAVWPIYPEGLGRWDQQLKSIPKAAKKWPWNSKLKKAFFRGSRTSPERDPLVLLSRKKPEIADASYTKNQAWKSDADTLGAPSAKEMTLEEHCQFKFLFNFRGVAASFRFKHLFLCNSLVYHVDDKWLEFFYSAMKPWVHYIPVNKDLKEAEQLINFAIENDDIAKAITRRGRKFIMEHLRMEDIICYWKELITKYTDLLKFKPKLNKNLIRIQ